MIRSIACMPQLYTLHTAAINHITVLRAVIRTMECHVVPTHIIKHNRTWDSPFSMLYSHNCVQVQLGQATVKYTVHIPYAMCVPVTSKVQKHRYKECMCQTYHHKECMCQKHRHKVGMCAHTKMAGRDNEEHAQKVHVRCECASTELTTVGKTLDMLHVCTSPFVWAGRSYKSWWWCSCIFLHTSPSTSSASSSANWGGSPPPSMSSHAYFFS